MKLLTVLVLSALVSLLICGCGGGGSGGSAVLDTQAPAIASAAIVPPNISFPSGSVTVNVVATDNFAISKVELTVTNSLNANVSKHTLVRTTGNNYVAENVSIVYSGTIPQVQTFTLNVQVTDTSGNMVSRSAGQIIFEPELPPAPPG